MSRKYRGLSWVEHVRFGSLLRRARETIMQVGSSYPKTSKVARLASSLERRLNEFKFELEGVAARENPGRDDAEVVWVYGGASGYRDYCCLSVDEAGEGEELQSIFSVRVNGREVGRVCRVGWEGKVWTVLEDPGSEFGSRFEGVVFVLNRVGALRDPLDLRDSVAEVSRY